MAVKDNLWLDTSRMAAASSVEVAGTSGIKLDDVQTQNPRVQKRARDPALDDPSTQNSGGVRWALVGRTAAAAGGRAGGRADGGRECKLQTKTPHNDVGNNSKKEEEVVVVVVVVVVVAAAAVVVVV